jgi:hypothetical protein
MQNDLFSREIPRGRHARRSRPRVLVPSERPLPATAVLVVDRDPLFCGELARLARLKGVGAAFAWGAENVDQMALAGFGAAIVDAEEWGPVIASKDPKVQAFLAHVPIVVVSAHGNEPIAPGGRVRAVVSKLGGANAALLAAIEAPLTLAPQLGAVDH